MDQDPSSTILLSVYRLFSNHSSKITTYHYHYFRERIDCASDEDDGGEETGDEEDERKSSPGLSPTNLHLAGVDNDPVSVHGNDHHGERRHEHGDTGERLDEPAEGQVVGHRPGHVEPVHHSQGEGGGGQQVAYCQVEDEDVPWSS